MLEEIKITSDMFNAVLKGLNNHHKSYTFRHNGSEPAYQQDMEDILTDISIAIESNKEYITVDQNVMKGLVEQGVNFQEVN